MAVTLVEELRARTDVDITQWLEKDKWGENHFRSSSTEIPDALSHRAADEIERLQAALKEIATMKPSTIAPGIQHGPALLLSNCQRLARRSLRPARFPPKTLDEAEEAKIANS